MRIRDFGKLHVGDMVVVRLNPKHHWITNYKRPDLEVPFVARVLSVNGSGRSIALTPLDGKNRYIAVSPQEDSPSFYGEIWAYE